MRLAGLVSDVSYRLRGTLSHPETTLTDTAAGASCSNCGGGPVVRYCAACGQRQITAHDFSMRGLAHDAFQELTSLDGRLWRTVVTLIVRPGRLAREYFDGRGSQYMKPMSLFVLLNVIFFLVQPHTGLMQYHLQNYLRRGENLPRVEAVNEKRLDRALENQARATSGQIAPRPARVESAQVFEVHFEGALQNLKKSMLIVGIPVFSLALGILYLFQQRRMAEHLIFSSHIWAFFLVFMIAVTPVFAVLQMALRAVHVPAPIQRLLASEEGLILVMFVGVGSHLHFALRRMYSSSVVASIARTVVLFGVLWGFIIFFSTALFPVTLWSL